MQTPGVGKPCVASTIQTHTSDQKTSYPTSQSSADSVRFSSLWRARFVCQTIQPEVEPGGRSRLAWSPRETEHSGDTMVMTTQTAAGPSPRGQGVEVANDQRARTESPAVKTRGVGSFSSPDRPSLMGHIRSSVGGVLGSPARNSTTGSDGRDSHRRMSTAQIHDEADVELKVGGEMFDLGGRTGGKPEWAGGLRRWWAGWLACGGKQVAAWAGRR